MRYTVASVWSRPTEQDPNGEQHVVFPDIDLRMLINKLEIIHEWHTNNRNHNKHIRDTNNTGPGGVPRIPEMECLNIFVVEGGNKPGVCSYDPNNLTPVITRLGCNTL
jgi:hypothetical protein